MKNEKLIIKMPKKGRNRGRGIKGVTPGSQSGGGAFCEVIIYFQMRSFIFFFFTSKGVSSPFLRHLAESRLRSRDLRGEGCVSGDEIM